jgi:hypothetical protein
LAFGIGEKKQDFSAPFLHGNVSENPMVLWEPGIWGDPTSMTRLGKWPRTPRSLEGAIFFKSMLHFYSLYMFISVYQFLGWLKFRLVNKMFNRYQ